MGIRECWAIWYKKDFMWTLHTSKGQSAVEEYILDYCKAKGIKPKVKEWLIKSVETHDL